MTTFRDRQIKYLAQTVALFSTVFLSWTVAQGQQTQKKLGQIIFETLKLKNINGLDSLTLTIDEWAALAKSKKMPEKDINQYKDTVIKWRKDLKDRFAEILGDGTEEGIVWTEIILDSVQVTEWTNGQKGDSPNQESPAIKETFLHIYFSYKDRRFGLYKDRRFEIDFEIFQYKNKWKIGGKVKEILFSELITIQRKIGD